MANVTEGCTRNCSDNAAQNFIQRVNSQLDRSNALMIANAGLVLIMVAVSASKRHYRQVGVPRFVFQGVAAIYLPIVSYLASSIGKYNNTDDLDVRCSSEYHVLMLLTWTVLVLILGTNTSATIAVDDDDGQKLGPSIELLARAVWTSYLVFYYSRHHYMTFSHSTFGFESVSENGYLWNLLIVLCVLSLAKIALKFYAFEKARRSFAFGRNSRLLAGYMEQFLASEDGMIPPLIVMGEEKQKIEKTPHGYTIKQRKNSLVTLDRVWGMATDNDILLAREPWLKDLCLSFALFKLLKHQFANLLGSTKAFNFVLNLLLNNGNPDTIFRVIADEVSFVLDSYYSSLPTSNFGRLLPVLNTILSLSIISWCLLLATKTAAFLFKYPSLISQIICIPSCKVSGHIMAHMVGPNILVFGDILNSCLPTYSLFVAVILAKA